MLNFIYRRYFFVIILIFSGLSAQLWAEQIESIHIEGPKRTREETLLSIIDVSPGDEINPDLAYTIEQKLRKSGLFQESIDVKFSPGDQGQVLNITVYDRWTLIGIPFFAVSSGDLKGGLVGLDTNLAGTGNFLLVTMLFSAAGDAQSFILYNDPTAFASEYSGRISIGGGISSVAYTSLDGEDDWESFRTASFDLGLGAGRNLGDSLEITLVTKASFWENSENGTVPPDSGVGQFDLVFEGKAEYDGLTFYPLFNRGISGKVNASAVWETGQNAFTSILAGDLSASWAIDSAIMVKATAKAGYTNDPFHYLFRLGGSAGSLSLPSQKIATDQYAIGELKTEFRLLKFDFGYLTAPLFYEGGFLLDYRDDVQVFQGTGGGFRFYLDKVAIPALGLDYRYNFTTDVGGVSFFIGMSY